MIKKILIPIDFTVRSLSLVKEAMERTSPDEVEVLLVHTVQLPYSITDLLFFSKEKFINAALSDDFKASWNVILNKYASRLKSLSIELYTGHTNAYLRNFLEGNQVTDVFLPTDCQMELRHKFSVNPIPLFSNCPVNLVEVPFSDSDQYGLDDLSSVFFLKARA